MHIPFPDVIAATLQTQPTHLASVGWGDVGNDTSHYDILDGLAVRTRHLNNLLTKEATPLIDIGLVATVFAAIFQFPCHLIIPFRLIFVKTDVEQFPFTHTDAGMTALMRLIAVVTTLVLHGAVIGDGDLIDGKKAETFAFEK